MQVILALLQSLAVLRVAHTRITALRSTVIPVRVAEVFSLNAVGVSIVIVVVGYTLLPLAFMEVEG